MRETGGIRWSALSPRERDTLVAEKVMGGLYARYSGDWRAMANLTNTMRAQGWTVNIELQPHGPVYVDMQRPRTADLAGLVHVDGEAPDAPEAVCIAALRAIGIEVDA